MTVWVGLVRLSGNYHWIDGTEYTKNDGKTDTKCMSVGILLGLANYNANDCTETKHFVCEDYPPPGRSTFACNFSLLRRHNGRDGVSNHQPHDCLLNRSFRRRSKKTSKFRVTGLCAGNSAVTGEFPAQMASDAENASI